MPLITCCTREIRLSESAQVSSYSLAKYLFEKNCNARRRDIVRKHTITIGPYILYKMKALIPIFIGTTIR